jgi:16S rRNA (cytidine1402-2'-O)-methyltransferase
MSHEEKGCLYVVSTPIGNLGDITYRSVEILGQVSLIAAEDTRRTRILLNNYEIDTPLSSYNSYNQTRKGPEFIKKIIQGDDIALVSDAGTPGVSDPLYNLVQLVLEQEMEVISIPGPSAILSALTVSGLPMDRFRFEGFLPRKKRRKRILQELAEQPETVVMFESPLRIEKTLNELREVFGNRKAAITRELTKMHEEVLRGGLDDLCKANEGRKWKGEITLVLSGKSSKNKNKES